MSTHMNKSEETTDTFNMEMNVLYTSLAERLRKRSCTIEDDTTSNTGGISRMKTKKQETERNVERFTSGHNATSDTQRSSSSGKWSVTTDWAEVARSETMMEISKRKSNTDKTAESSAFSSKPNKCRRTTHKKVKTSQFITMATVYKEYKAGKRDHHGVRLSDGNSDIEHRSLSQVNERDMHSSARVGREKSDSDDLMKKRCASESQRKVNKLIKPTPSSRSCFRRSCNDKPRLTDQSKPEESRRKEAMATVSISNGSTKDSKYTPKDLYEHSATAKCATNEHEVDTNSDIFISSDTMACDVTISDTNRRTLGINSSDTSICNANSSDTSSTDLSTSDVTTSDMDSSETNGSDINGSDINASHINHSDINHSDIDHSKSSVINISDESTNKNQVKEQSEMSCNVDQAQSLKSSPTKKESAIKSTFVKRHGKYIKMNKGRHTVRDIDQSRIKTLRSHSDNMVLNKLNTAKNVSDTDRARSDNEVVSKQYAAKSDTDRSLNNMEELQSATESESKIEQFKDSTEGSESVLTKESKDGDASDLPQMKTQLGTVIWGKFGSHVWWPGMVVSGNMFHMEPAKSGCVWVYWFGDHQVSEIGAMKTMPFVTKYGQIFEGVKGKPGKRWKVGVLEAIRVCEGRMGSCSYHTEDDIADWAASDYILSAEKYDIPDTVQQNLRDVGERILASKGRKAREIETKNVPRSTEKESSIERDTTLESLHASELDIQDVCVACLDTNDPVVCSHPFFEGGLCQSCKEQLMETMYAVGEDGSGAYCTVCGSGGDMFVCSALSCQRVFCCDCIEDFAGQDVKDRISATDPWLCFLCDTTQQCGLLTSRPDWSLNILNMFNTSHNAQPLDKTKLRSGPLRVLSLFDGIGTGRCVLDSLGLEVEAYFACEVDSEALRVSNVNFGDKIIQLGDVTALDRNKIEEICPIDLVIGGSPCNDISNVNPARKGLYDFDGTGVLFFEFHRVLNIVRDCCHANHTLWMFENVAFMPREIRSTITRFLQCEPALWDAKFFSAQRRPRLFWGNIPGMYTTPDVYLSEPHHSLQDALTPHCDRHAKVDKLRTLTTRSNSLRIGKHDAEFPVRMGGENDTVWIQELERIFGFPEHFTDVSNLTVGKRQRLLGKAWSVIVVKRILASLTQFFPTISE